MPQAHMPQRSIIAAGRTTFYTVSGPKGAAVFELRLSQGDPGTPVHVSPYLFTHRPLQPYEDLGTSSGEMFSHECIVLHQPCASTEPRGVRIADKILQRIIHDKNFSYMWTILEDVYTRNLDEPVET